MFPLQQSSNPFDYMGSVWTVFIVILVITAILFVVGKPLHKYLTDLKTRRIIEESGGSDLPVPGPGGKKPEGEGDGEKDG